MAGPAEEFEVAARVYCSWCESAEERVAAHACALLARLVNTIQRVELSAGGELDPPRMSHDEWKRIHESFSALPFQYYRIPFTPQDLDPVDDEVSDLHDDLADIWRDLRAGMNAWDAGDQAAAAFEWRYLFQIHWGRHAAGALYALHCWLADNGDPS